MVLTNVCQIRIDLSGGVNVAKSNVDLIHRCIIHDIRKSGYIKLPDDITLKNVVILIVCVIRNGDKFSPRLFLEEPLGCKNVGKSW